ncbi:MAG: DUF3987 domain-containing protein [Verrucomicrobiales bacterium]
MKSITKKLGANEIAPLNEAAGEMLAINWATYPLAEREEKDDILAEYAHYLARQFKLPMESATLIACSAVIAAAGSTRSLQGPGTITTPLTLNLVQAGEAATMPYLAASETFQTLTVRVRKGFWARQHFEPGSFAEEEQRIGRLIEEAKVLDRKAQDDRNEWKRRSGDDYEEQWRTVFAANPPDFQQYEEEANEKRKKAFNVTAQLRLERFPAILLEGASPDEFLEVHKITPDGSIFNLDLEGQTWSALASERPQKARDVARRFGAGWRRSPYVSAGDFYPAATISSLMLMETPRFSRVWNSRVVEEGGLRRTLLVSSVDIPGTEANPERGIPGDARSRFHMNLMQLLHFRDWTKDENVVLSPQAQKIFFQFARDIQKAETGPVPLPREILQSAAQNVLRLSLALHLGGRSEDEPVQAQIVRKACHLVVWSAFGAKTIFERAEPASFREVGDDEEAVLAMVVRVRRKGSLTRRELFRTYHDQRSARLMPVLEKALEMGVLVEQADGIVSVPDEEGDEGI